MPRTDTLRLASKEKPKSEKELQKEKEEKEKEEQRRKEKGDTLEVAPKIEFLTVDISAPSSIDVYDDLTLTFPEPVASLDTTAFHLMQKVDTLWNDIPFEMQQDSLEIRVFNVYADWKPGESYSFQVDSDAVTGIYGRFIDKQKMDVKAKTLDSY